MSMKDTAESCSSRAGVDSSRTHPRLQQQQRHKLEAYAEVLRRLRKAGRPEVLSPSFEDGLLNHFNRLPERYALDVNVERAEDVLTHKKLLELAQEPANRPVFAVRLVQVPPFPEGKQVDSSDSDAPRTGHAQSDSTYFRQGVHPPLPFGSSPNLEALAFECSRQQVQDGASVAKAVQHLRPMHEITFSTHDKPKLLSLLTFLLAELGLNIHEAHAFSTSDGFSLDVFVVDGWPYEETKQLRDSLQKEIHKMGRQAWSKSHPWSPLNENAQCGFDSLPNHVQIPTDGTEVWEIDFQQLNFGNKVASGSHGDLYHGTYNSQDIAIKVLKPESVNVDMQQEFAQEVFIMRNIHHSNVVQFIGACTRPNFCIVTEFMSGGSVYDFLHRQKGVFEIPALLQVAIDVSRGMNYLHQNNIVHRDLKTANLLMDENEVVKVADFGVARVKAESGVMTAETGTYRWMAPEVIEHKPYDHKADVFSFGIVLWELLTAKLPYENLTPLQAAVGVVQKGLRPTIPKNAHPKLAELMENCWQQDPTDRPDFSEILQILQLIAKEVGDESDDWLMEYPSGDDVRHSSLFTAPPHHPHLSLQSLFMINRHESPPEFLLLEREREMGSVKVYGPAMSTAVSRVMACLLEKEMPFQLLPIHLPKAQHKSPDFLKLQPFGQVPAFQDGDGTTLFESRAICRYICDKFAGQGNRSLLGREGGGAADRARVDQWVEAEAHSFNPPSSALVFQLVFAPSMRLKQDPAAIRENEAKLRKVLGVYERRLAESRFLAGDEFSLADLCHLPNAHYIVSDTDKAELLTSRKNVARWWEEISARPSWKKVLDMRGAPPA